MFCCAYDTEVRVVVLTGKGDAFSAGGDTNWMESNLEKHDNFRRTIREAEEIIQGMVNLEKPIIAKVNGDATGLGATLALS